MYQFPYGKGKKSLKCHHIERAILISINSRMGKVSVPEGLNNFIDSSVNSRMGKVRKPKPRKKAKRTNSYVSIPVWER